MPLSNENREPRGVSNDDFDYIIVGSGAGGAPLAARLAQAGKRVLLLEAGEDHGQLPPLDPANEVSRVPGFHGVSTEHETLAWRFFVDHYQRTDGELPAGIDDDPKWHASADEQRDGIFYPRSSSVGGCTIHNAMITIAGPDSDWDDIADELADDSWRGNRMRAYFQRLEHNDYMPPPPRAPKSGAALVYSYIRDSFWWLLGYKPDPTVGKHGFNGWLHTSVADLSLGLGDKQLLKMLSAALKQAKSEGLDGAWNWAHRFLKGEINRSLDPNDRRTQNESPDGVVLIPVAVYGSGTTIHQNRETPYAKLGHRSSPRELLHETLASCGDRLTIRTNCFVTKVLFETTNGRPRAVGVSYLHGKDLYKAHVHPSQEAGTPDEVRVKVGGEVILSGGTFNTPQLLMLSGIGDREELRAWNIDCLIHSPGVGKNLQDRYEVSVVGEMKRDFDLLKDASFRLPDSAQPIDRHLRRWREEGTGLYASNGAVLGIFKRSRPDLPKPDLFLFGLPLEFRGYSVGYSEVKHHNRFTWVVLKSHSHNRDGQVSLRSAHPLDTPKINFHSFQTKSHPNDSATDPDVLGIAEGVRTARGIFKRAGTSLVQEIHPNLPENDSDAVNRWIRSQAWGHHACGTCRMGRDDDPGAVLDSQFRVRGTDGLRVVDASIFPKIPGYFIVTNIYMASEKAADVILESASVKPAFSRDYPKELYELESEALNKRREVLNDPNVASTVQNGTDANYSPWNNSVTGLAVTGGGVRCATWSLGVLQCLARSSLLRRIDLLSTVSGGGYIGACIGRLYDRQRSLLDQQANLSGVAVANRVETEIANSSSPLIRWLRKHGNYIAPNGQGDGRVNSAIFIRNLLSVHFVIGLALFTVFGLANIIRYDLFEKVLAVAGYAVNRADFPIGHLVSSWLGPFYGPWFVLVELLLLFLVLPRITGYWIVSQDKHEAFKRIPLLVLFVLSAVLLWVGVNGQIKLEPVFIALALLSSLIQVELAWKRGRAREAAGGTGGVETQRLRTRNYLTYDLGLALAFTGAAFVFAAIDTIGHALQQYSQSNATYTATFAALGASIVAVMPIARWIVGLFMGAAKDSTSTITRILLRDMMFGLLAIVLFTLPLVFYSFAAHAVFQGGTASWVGPMVTLLTLFFTGLFAHPRALTFVNRSSLAQTYAARLARAYLGASNPLRYRPEGINITEVIPGDDVPSIQEYQPHLATGPLHIINVTVNQTVDYGSRLQKRDRQGENMAVSSLAVSVGEKWHSRWRSVPSNGTPSRLVQLEPVGLPLGDEHPLVDQLARPACRAEKLSLRQWIGISGAAIDPGRGQNTNLGTSLLMGLINLRTGHWWDSGIPEAHRSGFPNLSFSRRILYLIPRFFATQCLLIFEWIARFPGPWERFWHLSDGGFFENTGAYELIRRRLPRIIVGDGSADPKYDLDSFSGLVRKVRIDFGATIESFTSEEIQRHVPADKQRWVGTISDIHLQNQTASLTTKHAALLWVTYADNPSLGSVMLYIKASLNGDEPIDVVQYHQKNEDFPHESTADQFFDEAQWESYRKLGEHAACPLFSGDDPAWFWRLPSVKPGPRPMVALDRDTGITPP